MDLKEIRKIVELMNEHELSYFHLEEEGVNIKLKKGADIVQVAQAAMPAAALAPAVAPAAAAAAPEAAAPAAAGNEISAPMVGTFYASPNPESPAFVKVGDTISEGQTLCIIEAMKVMNEIKAEVSGTITECVANDSEPVQYGDPLFRVQ